MKKRPVHYLGAGTQILVGADTSLYKERPAKRSSYPVSRAQRRLRRALAPERLKSLAIRIWQGETMGIETLSSEEREILTDEYGDPVAWAHNFLVQQGLDPTADAEEIRARILWKTTGLRTKQKPGKRLAQPTTKSHQKPLPPRRDDSKSGIFRGKNKDEGTLRQARKRGRSKSVVVERVTRRRSRPASLKSIPREPRD